MINKKRTVTGACELFFVRLSHQCNNKTILNNCSLNYLLRLWCRCQCTRFHTTSCCVYLKRSSDTPVWITSVFSEKPEQFPLWIISSVQDVSVIWQYELCRYGIVFVWSLYKTKRPTTWFDKWLIRFSINMKAWYLHKDYITLNLSLNEYRYVSNISSLIFCVFLRRTSVLSDKPEKLPLWII